MTEEVKYEEAEVVEDSRTGEIIPRGSPEQLKPGILAQININQVGTLDVDEQAEKVLTEPLNPAEVLIRPDGLVYLPWTWYNKRLNRAFGLLKWGLIPQGSPQIKEMGDSVLIVWLNWLIVKGIPVSMAGGETSYRPSNYTMSYGDAMEGARTNSLSRNCKNLGMAIELWDVEWVTQWKKVYAETYKNDKGKTLWRKKGLKPQNVTTNQATTQVAMEEPETKQEEVQNGEPKVAMYSVSDMRRAENVIAIKGATGDKPVPEIMKVINSLDKSKEYSIEYVVKLVSGSTEESLK